MFSEPQKKRFLCGLIIHCYWILFCLGSWSSTWSNWLINVDLAAGKKIFGLV